MKILYVAKHNAGGTDEEGAITHALETLGHTVLRYDENEGLRIRRGGVGKGKWNDSNTDAYDWLLCHHWHDTLSLKTVQKPKVFWCFDLVEALPNDPILLPGFGKRVAWAKEMLEICQLGLFTDGEFVDKITPIAGNRVYHLPQAADQRLVGVGAIPTSPTSKTKLPKGTILFTGTDRHSVKRQSFTASMRLHYPGQFMQVVRGTYREDLKNLISGCYAVVAPDSPSADKYWSNRVYTSLGYGALLFHPRCTGLEQHYKDREEIIYYSASHNHAELHQLLDYYLTRPTDCAAIRAAGLTRTQKEHTYLHRMELLLKLVEDKLL